MMVHHQLSSMGLVRLKVREFAAEKGWTLKEVSERSDTSLSVHPFSSANSRIRNLIKPIDKELDLVYDKFYCKKRSPLRLEN